MHWTMCTQIVCTCSSGILLSPSSFFSYASIRSVSSSFSSSSFSISLFISLSPSMPPSLPPMPPPLPPSPLHPSPSLPPLLSPSSFSSSASLLSQVSILIGICITVSRYFIPLGPQEMCRSYYHTLPRVTGHHKMAR